MFFTASFARDAEFVEEDIFFIADERAAMKSNSAAEAVSANYISASVVNSALSKTLLRLPFKSPLRGMVVHLATDNRQRSTDRFDRFIPFYVCVCIVIVNGFIIF